MTSSNMSNVEIVMQQNEKICTLPTNIKWESSGILVDIKPDNNQYKIVSVKDPTIQKYNGQWLVYATVYNTSKNTWNMQFIKFTDFNQAKNEAPFFMDKVNGFGGYKCAPELSIQNEGYCIYLAAAGSGVFYNPTPDNPNSWSGAQVILFPTVRQVFQLPIVTGLLQMIKIFTFSLQAMQARFTGQTYLLIFPMVSVHPRCKNCRKRHNFRGSYHYRLRTANTYLHVVEGMEVQGTSALDL
jgi:hypothetical protein